MRFRKTFPLLAVAATLILVGAGCYSTTASNTNTTNSATTSSSNTVSITNFSFAPTGISVKAGTAVTWTNNDSTTHTITGDNGGPASGNVTPGGTYSFTFSTAGTFAYHCKIHPSMTGTITVTP